ncbi:FecR family protein [Fodinibius salsisoli]|uniref:FecR domain-containing protein n=1 Tax=Fodinibius salsisoli TaxID=2820877 RepID=A0ABT3PQ11_9BACT|nr:FecR domain-containing protein [Fodinibius salsisoli]MCW9707944.1 FecR domain-containing protein [Fodinibius salsisoli]
MEWIKEDPENEARFEQLRKTWDVADHFELQQNEDKAWQKLSKRISRPDHLKIHRLDNTEQSPTEGQASDKTYSGSKDTSYQVWALRAAAICLLFVGVMYAVYNYAPEKKTQEVSLASTMQEVKAERGQRLNLTLDDGTSVVLNSASVLRYPSQFSDSTRKIELDGEAFFSVAKDKSKPFLVHTGEATVRVLGTKFNVNAYAEDEEVEVVVAEGKVAVKSAMSVGDRDSVSSSTLPNEVFLTKGEYTIVGKESVPTTPVTVTSMDYHLGWVDGNLIFDATPLEEVIRRLELYYNRDFQVTNAMLLDRKLTATFKKESLSKVLDVLSIAMDVKYEQVDSLIYLEPYSPSIQNDYSNK